MDELAGGIASFEPGAVLPVQIPMHFIRGVKSRYDPDHISLDQADMLDFMRGEETQMAGVMESGRASPPFSAIVLSSHTKLVALDRHGHILGSITTLSGQVHDAVVNSTLIGKSVAGPAADDTEGDGPGVDTAASDLAFDIVERSGFLRALMIPRFMDTLMNTTAEQRRCFLGTAIAVEDMHVLRHAESRGFSLDAPIVLIGARERCEIYAYVIRKILGMERVISTISDPTEIEMLAIRGALDLVRRAGIA